MDSSGASPPESASTFVDGAKERLAKVRQEKQRRGNLTDAPLATLVKRIKNGSSPSYFLSSSLFRAEHSHFLSVSGLFFPSTHPLRVRYRGQNEKQRNIGSDTDPTGSRSLLQSVDQVTVGDVRSVAWNCDPKKAKDHAPQLPRNGGRRRQDTDVDSKRRATRGQPCHDGTAAPATRSTKPT